MRFHGPPAAMKCVNFTEFSRRSSVLTNFRVDKDRFRVCILLWEVPTASAFEMLKIFRDLATRVNVDVSASCFGVVILT